MKRCDKRKRDGLIEFVPKWNGSKVEIHCEVKFDQAIRIDQILTSGFNVSAEFECDNRGGNMEH